MFGIFRNNGRSVGKQVSSALDIKTNLFLTSLEQVMPAYLELLSSLHKEGSTIEELCEYTAPFALQGLDVLEQRFGPQKDIDDARSKLNKFLSSNHDI